MGSEYASSPLNVGFIGCGNYAQTLSKAVVRSSALNPVLCYDPDSAASQTFSGSLEVPCSSSLEELLDSPDVEAVIIASPNSAHRENAQAAAAAGKHVFVDKPIANDVDDAVSIIDACRANKVILAVGHNARFHSGHRKMKQMIDAGEIGSPIGVEANFSHDGGLKMKPKEWRQDRSSCPALPLMQLGVHFVDTIHYFLGFSDEVFSYAQRSVIEADNDDSIVSLIKLKSGPLAYVGSYYACPHTYYILVHGTRASVLCDGGVRLSMRHIDGKGFEPIEIEPAASQIGELEDFVRAVRTGERPEVDGETGLQALAVVRAAIESAAVGCPVKTEDILRGSGIQLRQS